jgi:hypothetical protein
MLLREAFCAGDEACPQNAALPAFLALEQEKLMCPIADSSGASIDTSCRLRCTKD